MNGSGGKVLSTLIVVALLLAGLAAGILTAGLATVGPALHTLPTGTYITVKQAFDHSYPRVMIPLQLASIVASSALTVTAAADGATRCATLSGFAVLAIVTNVVVTVRGDKPINIAMASWQPDAPPADWREQRARWETFNRIRTGAAVLGLVLLALAAVVPR